MQYTTSQQINAIRGAIKGLKHESAVVKRKEQDATTAEILQDIDNDVAALETAIETIRQSEAFRAALKTFIS